jgi:hypothetical protein
VTAADPQPLPGRPDLEGARRRHPAAVITESRPGYKAELPDGTKLAAMTIEGLESKIRTATGKGKRP